MIHIQTNSTAKLGTYSVFVSTWNEPYVGTVFVDNRFGRDSFQKYNPGKPLEAAISVNIMPRDDMIDALNVLLAAIEAAGFIRT